MPASPFLRPAFAAALLVGSIDGPLEARAYDLFHPVPPEQMRELNADRPDLTESPFTVDAGHFQVEVDVVKLSYDRDAAQRVQSRSFGTTNFKAGLWENVDLQLVVPFHEEVRTHDRREHSVATQRGAGDLTLRGKVNLWGNAGGPTAFGLMPFLQFPTAEDGLGSDRLEGGLILPLAIQLPGEWDLGLMLEGDLRCDTAGHGYHAEIITSVTAGHQLFGPLSGYGELASIASAESGARWIALLDLGLTWAVNPNLQFDAGINVGLTRAAEDLSPFVGLTWRF